MLESACAEKLRDFLSGLEEYITKRDGCAITLHNCHTHNMKEACEEFDTKCEKLIFGDEKYLQKKIEEIIQTCTEQK